MAGTRSSRRRLTRAAALAAIIALASLGAGEGLPDARATVPAGEPAFSNPLDITNAYFPVVPGAVKVMSGRADGRRITIVESHLTETRDFEWRGQVVPCRIVQQLKFDFGTLVEREWKYFAQADDGAVYQWGEKEEVEDGEEDEDEEEPNGWVVGQRAESDPPDTIEVAAPAVYMPSRPERGDLWTTEDAPPCFVATYLARNLDDRVRVPAGSYDGCLQVLETDVVDGDSKRIWFAPGTGPVKLSGGGDRLRLQAGTIRPVRPETHPLVNEGD